MELSGTINRSITLSGSMIARGLDGRGIVSIAKTGTSGLVDTYTITYTDETTSTFTVTNGANGQITATSFAEEFSSSKAYAAGDYVVYSGQLYQFTTAHAAGAWNASHATAVQIADQVSELKSALQDKVGIAAKRDLTLYDNVSGTIPTTNFANTRRWFFNHVFANGETIESITFKNYRATAQTITFEIWTKDGNVLTKVKTIEQAVNSQSIYTTEINYQGDSKFMLSFVQTTGTICYDSASGTHMIVSADVSTATDSLNYSGLSAFPNLYPCVSIAVTSQWRDNIVFVGDGQKYTEIQDAIEAITDDSTEKPYTIFVMPRGTAYNQFSMIRKLTDSYPWSNIKPRHISIIGLDRAHCVVQSDSGDYLSPCAELMTNGVIKNLSFKMTHTAQTSTATKGGYCAHIDCRTLNDVGYDMTIEDCVFENDTGPCLGIGIHANCHLRLCRCKMTTTLNSAYVPHDGYRNLSAYGVVFCHTSTLADAQNQRIDIANCIGECKEGDKSLWIATAGSYDSSTASFTYELINNVFYNDSTGTPAYSIATNITASPMNFGNNIPSATLLGMQNTSNLSADEIYPDD